MRTLIAEDDFTCRRILMQQLLQVGECDAAVSGNEAVQAFTDAMERGQSYDLVCLDITMANGTGHDALLAIRAAEREAKVRPVPVIMTTIHEDSENVLGCFREQCEAYLVKPITPDKLWPVLAELGLPVPAARRTA